MASAASPSAMLDLKTLQPEAVLLVWLGRLGDFIVSTPFLESMRKRFPRSRLVLLTGRKAAEAARLVDVDERWTWGVGAAARLASARFGLAVDLNPSASRSSGFATLLSKAPARVCFEKTGSARVYTHTVPHRPEEDNIILAYGRLAEAFGAPFSPLPRLAFTDAHRRAGRELLASLRPDPKTAWLAVHAGNFKKVKNRWPEDKFVELTRRLLRPGLTVFYVAGPGEEAPVRKLVERLPGVLYLPPAPTAVAGSALGEMDLLLANSTGTQHLAAAAGTPTFALYSRYTSIVWSLPAGPHSGVVGSDWEDCRVIAVDEAYRTLLPTLEKILASPRPKALS